MIGYSKIGVYNNSLIAKSTNIKKESNNDTFVNVILGIALLIAIIVVILR